MSLKHHRAHLLTLEGEVAVGKLRLAAEVMALLSEDLQGTDDAVVDPYIYGVAGADYRSGRFFGEHRLHLFVDLWVTRSLTGDASDDLFSPLRHPFSYAAFGRIRYEIGEALRVDVNLLSALDRFDLMIHPSVQYVLLERATIELGGAILRGDGGFLGRFSDNTRVMASVEVSF